MFKFFAIAVVVLFSGGAGLWFVAADQLEKQINTRIQKLENTDRHVNCDDQEIRGFPFRLGIFCSNISFRDDRRQTAVNAGELRSAAQFYAPGKIISELDGPARMALPNGSVITADWKLLRSSLNINLDGLKRISTTMDEVKFQVSGSPVRNAEALALDIHARLAEENNLQAAFGARNFVSAFGELEKSPEVSFSVEVTAENVFDLIHNANRLQAHIFENGLRGNLSALNIKPTAGGKLRISGPYSIDNSGLLNGQFEISVTDFTRLADFFTSLAPDKRTPAIEQILAILSTMFSNQSETAQTLTIHVVDGNASWGFIPLGKVPKLF